MAATAAARAQYRIDKVMSGGRSALYYEDYVLSIQYFDRVISAKPYLYEPWYLRALAEFHLDNFRDAETDASQAISLNPYIDRIFELRAVARIRLGHYDGALADFTRAQALSPTNRDYWYNRAFCNYKLGRLAMATAQLDSITISQPTFAEAYSLKADIMLARADTLRAERLLEQSLRANAYNGRTWASLGRLSLLGHRWAQADSCLSQAVHFSPSMATAYVNRATARWRLGHTQQALSDLQVALDLKPGLPEALHNRALIYRQTHQQAKADADERAFAADTTHAQLLPAVAGLLVADAEGTTRSAQTATPQGHAPAIARHAEPLVAGLEPLVAMHVTTGGTPVGSQEGLPDSRLYLGFAPQRLNEAQSRRLLGVIDSLSAVIARTYRIADATAPLLLRAVASADAQDYASAINDLQVYMSLDSTRAEAYAERAFCRLRQAAYEGSDLMSNRLIAAVVEQDLLTAIALEPRRASTHYNLGTFRAMTGDTRGAQTELKRALEIDPTYYPALKNLEAVEGK